MTWTPVSLPTSPVRPEQSDTGGQCKNCGSPHGQPCSTSDCGTYDPAPHPGQHPHPAGQ